MDFIKFYEKKQKQNQIPLLLDQGKRYMRDMNHWRSWKPFAKWKMSIQASKLIIYKITRSFIIEEKKVKMLHFLYNCIFDSTNKQSSSE